MTASGRVDGIPENQARFAAVAEGVHHMEETHRAIADLVRAQAAANVPNTTGRGTGNLAGSLTAEADAQRGWIEHNTEYGTLIENRYQYVGSATVSLADTLAARYEQGLSEIVERNG
jgi:hypothetical protein